MDKRVIVLCPLEMEYDELSEWYWEEMILSTWKTRLDYLAALGVPEPSKKYGMPLTVLVPSIKCQSVGYNTW